MKLKIQLFQLVFCSFLSCLFAFPAGAAAFPGETLSRPTSGNFWLSQGFRLGTEGTAWTLNEKDPTESKETDLLAEAKSPLEGATYSLPNHPEARLRVEIEDLKAKATLESYTKRWVKEYYQYGFKILKTQPLKLSGHPTIVYDLLSRSKDVQIRQVIQVHKGKAIVITCSDEKASFQKSVTACNRMAQNLEWAKPKSETPSTKIK